jgi:hypothetical protein
MAAAEEAPVDDVGTCTILTAGPLRNGLEISVSYSDVSVVSASYNDGIGAIVRIRGCGCWMFWLFSKLGWCGTWLGPDFGETKAGRTKVNMGGRTRYNASTYYTN